MSRENRRAERFDDIGRVTSEMICALPGVLDDISLTGCKVHFPIPLNLDMENDYTLELKLSRKTASEPLELVCHPEWVKIEGNETHIGFSILTNQNTKELSSYIEELKENSKDKDDISDLIIDHQVNFIQ